MPNLKDIKGRISSVKSIKQITNAMKMVAAAKLRKNQETILSARPYANNIDKMLRVLKQKTPTPHPVFNSINLDGKELLIIVTADRGLCGSFNSTIIRYAQKYIDEYPNVDIICIGRKGYDYFRRFKHLNVIAYHTDLAEVVAVRELEYIKDEVFELYYTEKYSSVFVIYNEFKSAIQQNLTHKQIIPALPPEGEEVSKREYIYEPDEAYLIEDLGKRYLNTMLWRVMLESNAAEQGARMTAMENATNNADDLIKELSLIYNRERQAQITTEILEVVSGAEAVNN
jgi:F-type H+-transporting ATPase subunit gamma